MNKESMALKCEFCGEIGGANHCCELIEEWASEYHGKPVWLP